MDDEPHLDRDSRAKRAPRLGRDRRPRAQALAIARLAGRQHGVVGRWQLLAAGHLPDAVDHQIALGRLIAVHRGTYAVGHTALAPRGRWMAAVLAGGREATLSHRSAAMFWDLIALAPNAIDVTTPTHRRHRPGVRSHQAVLADDEQALVDGIRVTTAARTLLDLAAVVAPSRLERAVHEAEHRRLADATSLASLLMRHRGARGSAILARIADDAALGVDVTRKELEDRFRAVVRASDLPRPALNAFVEGFEVDASWPGARLAVELDGHAVHATRARFEGDRARDRSLVVAGWTVVRVTWRQLHDDPTGLLRDLRRLLDRAAR